MSKTHVLNQRPYAITVVSVAIMAAAGVVAYISVDQLSAEEAIQPAAETDVAALRATVDESSPQGIALADGVVTYAEHEQAIEAWVQCVADAGGSPTTWPGEGLRATRVSFAFGDADGEPDADTVRGHQATVAACQAQHLDAVDSAWAGQIAQPEGEALEALYQRLEACVARGGIPGQDSSGPMLLAPYPLRPGDRAITLRPDQQQAYKECALVEQATTGFRAPVPLVAGE